MAINATIGMVDLDAFRIKEVNGSTTEENERNILLQTRRVNRRLQQSHSYELSKNQRKVDIIGTEE